MNSKEFIPSPMQSRATPLSAARRHRALLVAKRHRRLSEEREELPDDSEAALGRSEELPDDSEATLGHVNRSKVRVVGLDKWRGASRGASITSSILNLANTNMGVGMLALPSAMASAGAVGGIGLLFMSAGIATFGSHLLAECTVRVRRPANLSVVTESALGCAGIILTDLSVIVIGTSCAIGYLIVVGDMLPEIKRWAVGRHHSPSVFDTREFWILATLFVVAPLAFLRRLDSLRFASTVVVAGVGIIIITVLLFLAEPTAVFDPCAISTVDDDRPLEGRIESPSGGGGGANASECRGSVVASRDAQHTLSALPTFLFAFAAQINVPAITSELHHPSPRRVWAVLLGGIGLTVGTYAVVAGGGYGTYGDRVTGDLLLSYPEAAIVSRVALVFVVLLSHPVVSFPVSPCVLNSCAILRRSLSHATQDRGRPDGQRRSGPPTAGAAAGSAHAELSSTAMSSTAMRTTAMSSGRGGDEDTGGGGGDDNGGSSSCSCAPPQPFNGGSLLLEGSARSPPGAAAVNPRPASGVAPKTSRSLSTRGPATSTFVSEPSSRVSISIYLLGTTLVALFVTDLGIVVSLAGALAATMVIFIAPGACFWSLHRTEPMTVKRLFAGVLCAVGTVLLPILVLLVLASHGYLGARWVA